MLDQLGIDNFHAVIDSVISNALLAASGFFISYNMKYYLPRREKYWYILIVSLIISFLWMLLLKGALWLIFKSGDPYLNNFYSSWGIRFGAGFLLISSMSMFSILWYTQEEQKETDSRKAETEKLSKEAELFRLRQQLQPHFLFNSLNSISALTGTKPEKARHMIQQLSDFLRGTLKKDEQQWNTLEEELRHLALYLDIEKVRFGHRLQTEIVCDAEMLHLKIPALILQPVMENAIKFGLYDTTGEVLIKLEAMVERNNLKIVVQNPFDPETSQPQKGTGFGLTSVKRRLFLLFGSPDLLKTKKDNEKFFTVILIPQIDEPQSVKEGITKNEVEDWISDEISSRVNNKIDQAIKKKN